ncbi:MAG: hypothetical protein Hyperionvirus40_4 [Hyperionvirus sp.]|uniref:Uncharacterized protein n=1 Tax=Hyperionvirus sp. TaxID=2487770 RepID=A0A3G5ACA7_9VIRU|nr:MAG: hypothetical protein Hyperionvirus40_4 [Hyperionvirus sp.]
MAAASAVPESKTEHIDIPNFFEECYEVKPKESTVKYIANAKELFKIDFPLEIKAYRPRNKTTLTVILHFSSDFKEIWIVDSDEEGPDFMTLKFFCYRAVGTCLNHMKNGDKADKNEALHREMLRKIFCHLLNNDIEGLVGGIIYKNILTSFSRSDLVCHEVLIDVLTVHGYKLKYEINIMKDKLLYTILLVDRWKTATFGHEINHSCGLGWQQRLNKFMQLMFDLKFNDYTIGSRV